MRTSPIKLPLHQIGTKFKLYAPNIFCLELEKSLELIKRNSSKKQSLLVTGDWPGLFVFDVENLGK